ncbi:MAG: DUF5320 domain-containing protein [Bacteroidota bacterium]
MKNSILSAVIISLTISACTTQKLTSSYQNDDVYSGSSPTSKSSPNYSQNTVSGAQIITAPDSVVRVKSGSSTFADDYNDYSYSSRVNRFNSSDTTKGYFDQSYTGNNSVAGPGNSDPNVNVYLGFGSGYGNYWGPSYSFGMGWGYPYSGWGYDWGWGYGYPSYGWYNPWYYPPYYSYPYGCCYCYNPWYNEGYPPYYQTDSYYGSRRNLTTSDGGTGLRNDRNTVQNSSGHANLNERTSGIPPNSRVTEPAPNTRTTGQTVTRSVPSSQKDYRYTRSGNVRQSTYQRSDGKTQTQARTQQPSPRYSRPENGGSVQRSGSTQSYSSPVYRQPKSSQEYLGTRTQNPGSSRTTPASAGTRSNQNTTVPGYRNRTTQSTASPRGYSSPSRSYTPGYSTPARSGSNYSSPSRSGGSGSYSAPAPSGGGSYSAPARSSGGSGSSPSGGSGGSGGGGGGGRRR